MLNVINEKSRAQNWVISFTTYRVKKKKKKMTWKELLKMFMIVSLGKRSREGSFPLFF